MEQSQWIGALLVESFLSQNSCKTNQVFLQKTFEYLGLSSELLEKDISSVPERPMECLYPIVFFKNPTSVAIDEPGMSQPPPIAFNDTEIKLEKFIALKMAKDQEVLVKEISAAPTTDDKVKVYHKFMAEMCPKATRVCQLIKYENEESLYKAMEGAFCPRIYESVFPMIPEEDVSFASQVAKLRYKESALGVTPDIIQKIRNVYTLAGSELDQMERHVSPYAKLACISRSLDTLLKSLGRVGADDLLPAVIYTIVQCSPKRLPSHLQYAMVFGSEAALNTQLGYCHTTLMVAVEVVGRWREGGGSLGSKGGSGGSGGAVGGDGSISCPKCLGLGGLNCFGEPCKKGENLYQMVCPTCDGILTVKGAARQCEQCSGKGAKAKLGYCEVTDPFAVGKCEVCRGKSFLFGDPNLSSTPPPTSPLSSFSQYYGSELTPSKYGFYRQSSSTQLERIMLPDLVSALVLFSLTSPPSDPIAKKRNPPSRSIRIGAASSSSSSASDLNSSDSSSSLSSSNSLGSSADAWRVGKKKEITVFYPAQVRSALKRMIHCLRSLGPVTKRDQEKEGMLEAAERTIGLKWVREMVNGRQLLCGEGYGINLGSDGVKEMYFHRVGDPYLANNGSSSDILANMNNLNITNNTNNNNNNPPIDDSAPHMHALIAVMGVLDPIGADDLDEMMREQVDIDCDKFILVWETQHLKRFGTTVKQFHHTSMQEARSSAAFPIAPLMVANQLKNTGLLANHPYIYLLTQARKGGKILAAKLIRMGLGRRPVTLVGVSFGALLVFSCLETLLEASPQYPFVSSLVENVIFIGANIPAETDRWNAIKPMVAGRIVNCFSTKDAFLKYFYQTVNSITGGASYSASGITAIPVTSITCIYYLFLKEKDFLLSRLDIENIDLSSFITSHAFYAKNKIVSSILNFVDVGGVECNKNYKPHIHNQNTKKSASFIPTPPPPPPSTPHVINRFVNTLHNYIHPS